jgi:hypothetical protein
MEKIQRCLKGAAFAISFRNEQHYAVCCPDSSVTAVTCYKMDDRTIDTRKMGNDWFINPLAYYFL